MNSIHRLLCACLTAPLILIAANSLAAPPATATSTIAVDCNKAETQADMNKCADDDLGRADRQLNKLYLQYRSSLSNTPRQNQLRDVQMAWIKYRDLSCRFKAAEWEGGSIQSMQRAICLSELTKTRSRDLQEMINCQAPDGTCQR
ncbi:lysozyme inhibitor LprI family protein [Herbaspirillum sp. RTI4]|uniref:lysozyme inhibitor LprI family protein n=1 Tax=Herbaspirillum sp. RTI4 TaxID=3048640 RepID=UPI002AB3D155|nr:lysozyme inhibitor LprI family protein [Herbaspirillum sp. RTI4]MDY7578640.1 lysozyme inhibitor LprI family protein [Herbaspirillum sp. RTI4]MEA9980662.1 lysozyme inhibitor LprI family protein [Herbaspirillum sp. RTI4]